ncbi:MAG TPA: hypothetical protein VK982_15480, partial [Bacteroidales bacterium]|nr:hypothetical protein [Bacteroidales bacterium]
MKISEVVEIVSPKYKYFKLTPNYSIRNNNTHKLARTIASLYKNIFQRIEMDNLKVKNLFGKDFLIGTKYNFNKFEKVGYYIFIEK